ncbi:hypothetical protein CN198_13970 [Sinorhizobium meliloti]|uniref:hypothetical protein n=1 Tax=Rhizobium meliloti TaxID=382 RepID=UPI000FD7D871|nr:hypothetical protein [Sinorhizobium meliloti]RVH69169.1 hypothetical protein CN198_13970 [Sinorhizobium meliloti]
MPEYTSEENWARENLLCTFMLRGLISEFSTPRKILVFDERKTATGSPAFEEVELATPPALKFRIRKTNTTVQDQTRYQRDYDGHTEEWFSSHTLSTYSSNAMDCHLGRVARQLLNQETTVSALVRRVESLEESILHAY